VIHIPVPELSSVWPQVRKHLASAVDKFGERVTPEELYYLLRQGNASLYLDDKGCIVVQKLIEMNGTVTLFVLLTAGKLAEVWEDCVALLEKLAETIGAVRIRMASPSRGWERAMNGYWSVAHVVYEHDLRNGNVQVAA
jgi:hypothetical protein